jgi:hypothetical protein
VKLLTLKTGEKLQDVSLVIPDGEDSDAALTSADDSESPDIDATLASADESETPDTESPEDTDAV